MLNYSNITVDNIKSWMVSMRDSQCCNTLCITRHSATIPVSTDQSSTSTHNLDIYFQLPPLQGDFPTRYLIFSTSSTMCFSGDSNWKPEKKAKRSDPRKCALFDVDTRKILRAAMVPSDGRTNAFTLDKQGENSMGEWEKINTRRC